jgi:hypothetical protein
MGILNPANSAIFAPSAICLFVNGVCFIFNDLRANVNKKDVEKVIEVCEVCEV